MAYGLPNISFIGYPVSIPCAGHGGLGFRRACERDRGAVLAHYVALEPQDRRMRFCATLGEAALGRHVDGIWSRPALVLAAFDGPLWTGPLRPAGTILGLAEVALADGAAELGLSVDRSLRRRGVGTYLVQAAAGLLAPRGFRRLRAYTLPGNASFLALARSAGAAVEAGPDEVEVDFDLRRLRRAYLRRRAAEALRLAA